MLVSDVKKRFSKASLTYQKEALVQKHMGEVLSKKLATYSFSKILEIGCGSGNFSKELLTNFPEASLYLNDLSPKMLELCQEQFKDRAFYIEGDAGKISFDNNFDLICGCASFQWFMDFKGTLKKLCDHLNDDGILAFAIFGKEHFYEVKAISGIGLDYFSKDSLLNILDDVGLQSEITSENITVHFKSALEMLRHFKKTGVGAISHKMWTRGRLFKFLDDYEKNFSDDLGVKLTWQPVYVVCKKIK